MPTYAPGYTHPQPFATILCLTALMGYYYPAALIVLMVWLTIDLLARALARRKPMVEMIAFDASAHLLHACYATFAAGSTLVILCGGPQIVVLDRLGNLLVDGHPRMLPLILFPLLVLHRGLHDRARSISRLYYRFQQEVVAKVQMEIDADFISGVCDGEQTYVRRVAIQDTSSFLERAIHHMSWVGWQSRVCIATGPISLLGGTLWQAHALDQNWKVSLSTCATAVLGQSLVMTSCALVLSTSMSLAVASYLARHNSRPEDLGTRLPQRREVLKAVGGLSAEVSLAWLGLPPGLSLIIQTLHRPQSQSNSDQELGTVAPLPISQEHWGPVTVEVSPDLQDRLDPSNQSGPVVRLSAIRDQLRCELGVVMPSIHLRPTPGLKSGGYRIRVFKKVVAEGSLRLDRIMLLGPEDELRAVQGYRAVDPVFSLPARWVRPHQVARASAAGCRVLDPVTVLATHLTEILRGQAAEVIDFAIIEDRIHSCTRDRPDLVVACNQNRELLLRILKRLLNEQVPLVRFETILETFQEGLQATECEKLLTELIRVALGDSLCRQHADATGDLNVVQVSLAPYRWRRRWQDAFLCDLSHNIEALRLVGLPPVVFTSFEERPEVRRLIRMAFPTVPVLCEEEIRSEVTVHVLAQVVPNADLERRVGPFRDQE